MEDPFGSRPHVGRDQIGRFYDTLISPRQLIFHRDFDVVSGVTVVRDLTLEVIMAPDVTLNVPTHLRYDLRESDGEWAIERLCAHWELPVIVAQMLRHGGKSLPPSIRLAGGLTAIKDSAAQRDSWSASSEPAIGRSAVWRNSSTRPRPVIRWRHGTR